MQTKTGVSLGTRLNRGWVLRPRWALTRETVVPSVHFEPRPVFCAHPSVQSGYTPLLCACQYQKAETVRALLGLPEESSPELGIPPGGVRIDLYATDTTKDGAVGLMSGLHIAAIHDSYEIASALLLKGCSLDIADAEVCHYEHDVALTVLLCSLVG